MMGEGEPGSQDQEDKWALRPNEGEEAEEMDVEPDGTNGKGSSKRSTSADLMGKRPHKDQRPSPEE